MFDNDILTMNRETWTNNISSVLSGNESCDVVLIQPPTKKDCVGGPTLATTENLGLAYLSSSLSSSGISNCVLDAEGGRYTEDDVVDFCRQSEAKIFGISPAAINMCTSIAISKELKNAIPASTILFGGHHATLCYREIMSNEDHVDAVVLGEAEDIIVPIVAGLLEGKPLYRHPSVATRGDLDNKQVNVIKCLNSLRDPARNFNDGSNECRLLTSRGCVGSCSFCTTPELFPSLRRRSVENIVREMNDLARNGKKHFWLNDDLFISGHPLCHKFANDFSLALIKSNLDISFRPMIRADSLNARHDTLKILEAAGMTHVFIGIESGNDFELSKLNKKLSSKENAQCLDVLKDEPLVTQIGFIMFTPWSSPDTLRENMHFLHETGQAYRAFPFFRMLSVFPHTMAHRVVLEEGLIGSLSYCSEDPFSYRFHWSVTGELARAQHLAYPKIAELDNVIYRKVSTLRLLGLLSEEEELRREATQVNMKFFKGIIKMAEYKQFPMEDHALALDDLYYDLSRIASLCSISSEVYS